MFNREPKNQSPNRLSRRQFGGLVLSGIALASLTACGPSETKATESPAPTASAPVTPGVSESPSPSASETAPVTVENSNITSITESEQFKALSPEDQALIKRLETLDFSVGGIEITEGVTGEMQQKFAKLALEVYEPYVHQMILADLRETGFGDKSIAALEAALANKDKGVAMSPEEIELVYGYSADSVFWMMTKNGDPTVLDEKRQTAINVAVVLNRMALPDGDVDAIKAATSASHRGAHLTFMRVTASTDNIEISGVGGESSIYRVVNVAESENHIYCYRPTLGEWKHMLTIDKNKSPSFVPDSELAGLTADDLVRLGA